MRAHCNFVIHLIKRTLTCLYLPLNPKGRSIRTTIPQNPTFTHGTTTQQNFEILYHIKIQYKDQKLLFMKHVQKIIFKLLFRKINKYCIAYYTSKILNIFRKMKIQVLFILDLSSNLYSLDCHFCTWYFLDKKNKVSY